MALASQGRVTEANKEAQQLAIALQATPPDAIWAMPFNNKTKDILTIANHVLAGKIAMAKQDTTRAVDEYQRAVVVEDSLNYGEPPDWYFPVREALGTALLARGDYKRAEEVFRADLQQHPRNGRSLFGLSQSLKAQGRNDDDAFVQRQFEVAWKDADTPLKPVEIATEK
jgi:tetratricopeptide (TPR) repeat protein